MIETMKQALEALDDANEMAYSEFSAENLYGEAITSLRQAIEQAEKQEVPYVLVERDGSGKTVISSICNPHPEAPHGFDRNASHGADRYVCECESWDAYDAGIEEGMKRERALWEKAENARELGLDYEPVQTEKQEPGYTTTRNSWTGRATYKCNRCGKDDFRSEHAAHFHECETTTPQPQRKWIGLTQQDIDIAFDDTQEGGGFNEFARAIEQILRRKNNDS